MIPNLFTKKPLPPRLPKKVQKIVDDLKNTKTREECLIKASDIITAKYRGYKVMTYTKFFDLYRYDIDRIWSREGFLHCTNINYLLRMLLIKSGKFTEEDIELKLTHYAYSSIHQYLRIRLSKNRYTNIDLWGKAFGIEYGDYMHGFHWKTTKKQMQRGELLKSRKNIRMTG